MRVLIIDDEASIRKTTTVALEGMGNETASAENSAQALKQIETAHFDVAFLDLKLNTESGLELLPKLLKINPNLDVVVFTAFASIANAVEAMTAGAVDYIPKPFTPDQIRQVLVKISKQRKLEGRLADLEFRLSSDAPTTDLTTSEPAMQRVVEVALKAASTPATIMILGESGTGKTVLARSIHENSPQKENAFVTISCPSLSRELLASELFGHVKGAFTGATNETWGQGFAGGRRNAVPGRDRRSAAGDPAEAAATAPGKGIRARRRDQDPQSKRARDRGDEPKPGTSGGGRTVS